MSFWKSVNKVIGDADIILEIVDARNIDGSRNQEIEEKVKEKKKELILVVNKCDLVKKEELEKKVPKGSIFVSSKEYHGLKMLRDKIIVFGKKLRKDKPKVGVLGYPNVGKSSLINAFSKGKAITSSSSGMTKGTQILTARNFILLDTPGVIPYKEKDEGKHAEIGAVDYSKTKDPEGAFYELYVKHKSTIESFYGIKAAYDEEFLEKLGEMKGLLKKGGVDLKRAAKFVLKDWQTGKMKQE